MDKGLTRTEIRYICSRLLTESGGGDAAPETTKEFLEIFEGQKFFTGWSQFGTSWDVDLKDPYKVVYRQFSIHEEWEATLRRVVPELPIKFIKKT